MSAQYPSAVKTFTVKTNFVDTVLAEHVNSLQDEVTSLETNLGTYLTTSSGWVGTFNQTTTTWNTLKDRLTNIEYGLNTAFNNRVSTLGGSTITPSSVGTVGVTVQAMSGQTADLVDFKTSAGTVVSSVGSDAYMYTSGKRLVPIVYASAAPTGVPAGTVWVDSSSSVTPLTATSGIPTGGTTGQVLEKNSSTNYDASWYTIHQVPAGGTTGQAFLKNSNTDYDATWFTIHQVPAGGTAGQVLTKNSATDYDTAWSAPAATLDPFLLGGM